MMTEKVYLLDMGVLLQEGNEQFNDYANVYDKKFGYYDELQEYRPLNEAGNVIREAVDYVKNGVPNTYAVVSVTELDPEIINSVENITDEINVEGEGYDKSDVVFSIYSGKDGELFINFVEGQNQKCVDLEMFANDYIAELKTAEREGEER